MKTATLKDSRKKVRDATRHLDVHKHDGNNVDLLDYVVRLSRYKNASRMTLVDP